MKSMRLLPLVFLAAQILTAQLRPVNTYSIVARDSVTGQIDLIAMVRVRTHEGEHPCPRPPLPSET